MTAFVQDPEACGGAAGRLKRPAVRYRPMRVELLVPLLLVGAALPGCLESPAVAPGASVEDAVRAHVQAVVDGDVDLIVSFYADDWADLGGGDGTPSSPEKRRASVEEFLRSERYREEVAGRDIEDLLDWASAEYRPPGAYGAEWDDSPWAARWTPGPDDVLVHVPPREGSAFHDGWFGFYRPADGSWVQVAGD